MLKTNFTIIVYFYLQKVERETVLIIIKKVQFLNLINDENNNNHHQSNLKKFKFIKFKIFNATNDIIF